jgi:hypothetical protein
MSKPVPEILQIRLDGPIKEHVCRLADSDNRSRTNMVERLIVEAIARRRDIAKVVKVAPQVTATPRVRAISEPVATTS